VLRFKIPIVRRLARVYHSSSFYVISAFHNHVVASAEERGICRHSAPLGFGLRVLTVIAASDAASQATTLAPDESSRRRNVSCGRE